MKDGDCHCLPLYTAVGEGKSDQNTTQNREIQRGRLAHFFPLSPFFGEICAFPVLSPREREECRLLGRLKPDILVCGESDQEAAIHRQKF